MQTHTELANTLKFGVAYKAISLAQDYPLQEQDVVLSSTGWTTDLAFRLDAKKGRLFEGNVADLQAAITR